ITAFTLGHSLTLALSALEIVKVNQNSVEVWIAITIGLTALQNVFVNKMNSNTQKIKYLLALVFGLIHGMGFSTYFRSLLGKENDLIFPLFSFNIGIELGQICIIAGML